MADVQAVIGYKSSPSVGGEAVVVRDVGEGGGTIFPFLFCKRPYYPASFKA